MTEQLTHWSQVDFPRLLRAMAAGHPEGSRERALLWGAAVELERVRTRESYLRRYVERLALALGKTASDARAMLSNPEGIELSEALRRDPDSRASVSRIMNGHAASAPTPAAPPESAPPSEPPAASAPNGRQPAWMKWKRIADSARRGRGAA